MNLWARASDMHNAALEKGSDIDLPWPPSLSLFHSIVSACLGRSMLFLAVVLAVLQPFDTGFAAPTTASVPPDPYESVNTSLLLIEGLTLENGTRITAWSSSDRQVGSGTVEQGRSLVVVRGDDATTPEIVEGAHPEEPIYLKVHPSDDDAPYLLNVHGIRDLLTEEPLSELRFHNDAFYKLTAHSPPSRFTLAENYPNPFRSSTTITYTVPTSSTVTLEVFNMLGQRVATLVDGRKEPGEYSIVLEAGSLTSGLYIYRLRAGSRRISRKMLVVR